MKMLVAFCLFFLLPSPVIAGQLFPPDGVDKDNKCPAGSLLSWTGDGVKCAKPTFQGFQDLKTILLNKAGSESGASVLSGVCPDEYKIASASCFVMHSSTVNSYMVAVDTNTSAKNNGASCNIPVSRNTAQDPHITHGYLFLSCAN